MEVREGRGDRVGERMGVELERLNGLRNDRGPERGGEGEGDRPIRSGWGPMFGESSLRGLSVGGYQ